VTAHLTEEQQDAAARGDAAFGAHLLDCADCRSAVRDAKGRQALLRGLTPYTLSDMAFRRVEARLMEQVDQGLPSPWPAWLKVGLPVALVAGALVLVTGRSPPVTQVPEPVAVAVEAPRAFRPMTVTFAAADSTHRRDDEAWQPLAAGAVVTSGTALSSSRLVLTTTDGPALVLEVDGAVAVGGQAMVALGAGTVSVAAQGEAEVLVFARRVRAVDAVFRVERTAAELILDVSRGEVTVLDDGKAQRRVVKAPARVRWADGTALEGAVAEPAASWAAPTAPQGPFAWLDLTGLPMGTALSVDGASYGQTPFSALLEAGRRRLTLTPPNQPTQERFVDLVGGQPFLVAVAPTEKDLEAPAPDARALARVMEDLRRQTPKLRACYEKWLKANPTAAGQVDLLLTVNARGKVTRASVRGDAISPQSAACLKTTAKSLVLSPLGSEQQLEVPLVLTPGGR